MKLRFYLSLIVAKLAYLFLKITKLSSGTAIIGLLTLKICPDFLIYANDYIKKHKINVTGTNGKTTTSGLLSHLIKLDNYSIINNVSGANMLNGIVNTLVLGICPFRKADISILETDEAFLDIVYEKFNSDYLLVTNLFEDQTDRFANPLITKSLIQKAIDKKPDLQLILNADDPISAGLKSKNKRPIYFGIENVYDENGDLIENTNKEFKCPICEKELIYTKQFYSQIGHYHCDCGYKRNSLNYSANVFLFKTHSIVELENEKFEIPLVGLYNAYNALGAIVLAKELNIKNIKDSLKTFKVAFGRSEKRLLNGHDTIIQLIKNPAGTNEIIKTIDFESNILIAVNNNTADGTDISWINQVEFEKLTKCKNEIVLTGLCCNEMSNRLKKTGITNSKIIPDINKAVEYISRTAEGNITILTTYTALLKIDKIKEIKKCY